MSEQLTPSQRRVLRVMREGGILEGFALKQNGLKIGRTTERVVQQLVMMGLIAAASRLRSPYLRRTYMLTEKGETVSLKGPTYPGHY